MSEVTIDGNTQLTEAMTSTQKNAIINELIQIILDQEARIAALEP